MRPRHRATVFVLDVLERDLGWSMSREAKAELFERVEELVEQTEADLEDELSADEPDEDTHGDGKCVPAGDVLVRRRA